VADAQKHGVFAGQTNSRRRRHVRRAASAVVGDGGSL